MLCEKRILRSAYPTSASYRVNNLGCIHLCGSATRSDCLDGQSSPKKRPLAGGSAGPSISGCPEVVEMRKECVGEPGCPLGFANLSITLGSRGAAVVNQLSA